MSDDASFLLDSIQRLEFVTETGILAEMNIENHRKIYFPWKKYRLAYFFFYEN